MLSGVTWSASETAGTAGLRMVVSSDSMKNATATSHGSSRLLASDGAGDWSATLGEVEAFMGFERPSSIEWLLREDRLSDIFSSRRRHTRCLSDWSSDVCSSD